MEINKILKVAVNGGASDIILKTSAYPRFRHNGVLVSLSDGSKITPEMIALWIEQLAPKHLIEQFQASGDVDFSYQSKSGHRFRVNLYRQQRSMALVLRVISNYVKSIDELQLPKQLNQFTMQKRGLILVTGATGSGKSTTLAAMIDKINETRAEHIVTIEDPIEFIFKEKKATISQREVGVDTVSFAKALRASLRQDPDIIFVGELRDKETTETALMAAETGHLVLSTLHTSDAPESINRLLSFFKPHQHAAVRQTLANTLKAVLSQRLVRRASGNGRAVAMEIMTASQAIRDLIEGGGELARILDLMKQGEASYGMQTFDRALEKLVTEGIITKEEALAHSSNRGNFELLLQGVS